MNEERTVVLSAEELSVKKAAKTVLRDISFTVHKGEQWGITGPAGSGKTTLLRALYGTQLHSGKKHCAAGCRLALVEQQHRFRNRAHTTDFYYQQRFQASDAEDAETVQEYLFPEGSTRLQPTAPEEAASLLALLDIHRLMDRSLLQLSNGEHKRVQLAQALLSRPQLLLLDQPYTGLDVAAGSTLNELLHRISEQGVQLLLVAPPRLLPGFLTHVLQLTRDGTARAGLRSAWQPPGERQQPPDRALFRQLLRSADTRVFNRIIHIEEVSVRYGDKTVLQGINWTVRPGERWLLAGPNGSGKSTLLSLFTGDHPQAYANTIYLFDRRRGKGESIWDIKKKIGYVSPELHLYFDASATVYETIASGYFDTIGLFRPLTAQQQEEVASWIQLLGLQGLAHKQLVQLSGADQRLALLVRALVKRPPLLILDEPAQGLDEEQAHLFRTLVEEICAVSDTTVIYVSHLADEVPACVRFLLRLEEGKVVEQGER
ncbi:MAG TPA: ATP-binding cassette domain-containing protein [Chitinophagaceae bacterium]|jgi:molybdate transport system ATP-binding protein|nr:ATP-binding cassette domain-containing protein [Chitinophagaceae bacterium]